MKSWERGPVNRVDFDKSWHGEGREDSQTLQVESVADFFQVRRRQRSHLCHIESCQAASNSSDTSELDVVCGATCNGDAARVCGAAGESGRVGVALNGGGAAGTALGWSSLAIEVEIRQFQVSRLTERASCDGQSRYDVPEASHCVFFFPRADYNCGRGQVSAVFPVVQAECLVVENASTRGGTRRRGAAARSDGMAVELVELA